MLNKIGILNCYADELPSAPSASYFMEFIENGQIINTCHGEKLDNFSKYDGIIISGSRSCHMEEYDWIKYLETIILEIYRSELPCLAVCFGHQLVAKIFGGNTVVKLGGEEGFLDVPTKHAEHSIELFNNLPDPVKIYQSHNDSVQKSPSGSINTLCNETCVQYFQHGPIHAIQSHPEITVSTAVKIAMRDGQKIDVILNGVNVENILSHKVIHNFISIVEKTKN
jgi:GMP synthase-like glutamine amidotransferase